MMTQQFKIKNILMSLVAVSLLISPFATFAKENQMQKDKIDKVGGFCNKLDQLQAKVTDKVGNKEDKFGLNKSQRIDKLSKGRSERDLIRQENWLGRDDKVDARITALLAKADTDAKKTAVTNFSLAIKDSIRVRRDSVSTAINTFRTGVNDLIKNKFGSVDGSVTTLRNSIDAAFANAKTSCTNGTSEATIKETLKTTIKSAIEKFKSDKSDAKIKDEIQALADTRKASVDTAIAKFKTDTEKARADLKAAFGDK